MIKIVCDRCGKEIYTKGTDLYSRAQLGHDEYDLCPACKLDVKEFITHYKNSAGDCAWK